MPATFSKAKVLAGYKTYLRRMREPALLHQKENQLHNDRRRRVAARFRERLVAKALTDVNIDLRAIEQVQGRDIESMNKFLKTQQVRVRRAAEERARRQLRLRREMFRRHRVMRGFRGNPVLTVCLVRADEISGVRVAEAPASDVDYSGSQPLVVRTANFDSAAEIDLSVDTDGWGSGFIWEFVDFHFIWMSDRLGILNSPVAELHLNGGWQIEIPPACFSENRGIVRVEAFFQAAQTDLGGAPQQTTSTPGQTLFERDLKGGGSDGYIYYDQLIPYHDSVNLTSPSMDVVAGYPVIFTVTVGIYVQAYWGASAEIDLRTGPFEINLPAIAFTVTS